jgi:hypothetical protein
MSIKHNIKTLPQNNGRGGARRSGEPSCTVRKLCVRCSMMKVVQHRFKAFRRAFGRNPLSHEPLFFTSNRAHPELAEKPQMMRQLAQAADATGVSLPPLLKFLAME